MGLSAPGRRYSFLFFAAGALLLPVIAILAFQLFNLNRNALKEVERTALKSAEDINQRVDAVTQSDLAALRVLAANVSPDDLARSTDILNTAIQINPSWRAVVLFNRETKWIVLEVAKPGDESGSFSPPADIPESGLAEGVSRQGLYCPCVRMHVPLPNAPGHALTAFIDPGLFQKLMMLELPEGSVGGIVDREGEFLARSVDYKGRVGTRATPYVLSAVEKGGSGFYRGKTYEGFVNYTAYATSDISGWSTHIAINHALIDAPQNMSTALLLVGAILCLAIAGGMIVSAQFELASRRREQERFVEMQKAEAVNEFTSTLVHDFRNLLAVMHASINLIVKQTKEQKTREVAEAARDVLGRSEKLVAQFLNFARREEPDNTLINVGSLFSGIIDLLHKSVGQGVMIDIRATDEFQFVGDARQMELAFINLLTNARDAMNGKGTVIIETLVEGDEGLIRVSDTGPGVPKYLRQRIFEAFYTTKPSGKGTGLGLAQVSAAVRQAGGIIEADEEPGGGAVFLIRLPLAKEGNVVDITAHNAN